MAMKKRPPGGEKKFCVFSHGIVPPGQTTLETLKAMGRCGRIYTTSLGPEMFRAYGSLGHRIVRVADDYAALERTILAALHRWDEVGFLTFGNPVFMHHPLERLRARISDKATVRVFPGVSSFDLLADILYFRSPAAGGVRLVDCASFRKGPVLTPGTDTLFFNAFFLGSREHACNARAFQRGLREAYPAGTQAYLISCTDNGGAEVLKGCVNCFAKFIRLCRAQHTLLIPSADRESPVEETADKSRFRPEPVCRCAGGGNRLEGKKKCL